jgi:MFS family permease
MIRNVQEREKRPARRPSGESGGDRAIASRAYDRTFWFCYLSNAMLMVAVSLLFRYADFVHLLGGSERHLGLIVGVGMIGALAVRISLGVGMDQYGPRRIWLASLFVFSVAAVAHLAIHTVHSPAAYVARMLLTVGIAGGVGASLTYVSLRVPEPRLAEMVGTIGTSGFVGLAIGPMIGDLLFRTPVVTRAQVDRMFALAALAGLIALAAALLATRGELRKRSRQSYPALVPLIRRYQPGSVLLVALAMGLGIGLPGVFLRAYTSQLGLMGIQTYFLVYAAVAFTVRIATRRLTQQIGIRSVILVGLSVLAASMVLYLAVHETWQLALPAAVAGVAHALLFPAVVAGGTTSFPIQYRGLATTLVLGMFDFGNLIGQPAVGNLLHYAAQWDLPQYPTMFLTVAAMLLGVAALYGYCSRSAADATRASHCDATRQDGNTSTGAVPHASRSEDGGPSEAAGDRVAAS